MSKPLARPVSIIEQIGERCLQAARDHANDKEPNLLLIADFMWALGVRMEISFSPRHDVFGEPTPPEDVEGRSEGPAAPQQRWLASDQARQDRRAGQAYGPTLGRR